MKLFNFSKMCFVPVFILLTTGSIEAQMSTTIPQSPAMKPLPQIQTQTQAQPAPAVPVPAAPSPKPIISTAKLATYFHPGSLVLEGGKWVGSDNLLNLTNQVGVYVEIVKPKEDKLNLSEEAIKNKVSAIFAAGGLTPSIMGTADQAPLPFFQIKIFLYPIERGYVASCEARLFESILLKRFDLDLGMAYQAITWNRQSLIVAPDAQAIQQIDQQVTEIANSFVEIFRFFDKRKSGLMK